jgi:hypothetical protein
LKGKVSISTVFGHPPSPSYAMIIRKVFQLFNGNKNPEILWVITGVGYCFPYLQMNEWNHYENWTLKEHFGYSKCQYVKLFLSKKKFKLLFLLIINMKDQLAELRTANIQNTLKV